MGTIMVVIAIGAGVGWMIWRRRVRWRTLTTSTIPEGIAPESLALEAFTHGNSCLAAGKFAEAAAAFQRSRELDPKRPHVAERIAEVERRQQAASSPPAAIPS
jgi:hypothetical protein